MTQNGIILFAKASGPTSFSSLHSIKKALGTTKVGHTGTLDSFAQGLLVVCVGSLTRLAGNIIEFDKDYQAVLQFGKETDTLEYTGQVIKEVELPSQEALIEAVKKHTGNIMQRPPLFSSIHVDGKRASDLARKGRDAEIPARPVSVYKAEIVELKKNDEDKVEYALINFSVSKGTYIRSLARDIGQACGSAAHLVGLYRSRVGHFKIEDAAGFKRLPAFTIETALAEMEKQKLLIKKADEEKALKKERQKYIPDQAELELQEEIRQKIYQVDKDFAGLCGFGIINLISDQAKEDFENGRSLRSRLFDKDLHSLTNNSITAVFTKDDVFAGLIDKDENGRVHYRFVKKD
ncbi:MAG: tRNA pseudouridine(55) synthase TruB [Treponema sp.]|nr:tRNA pseudouridine(55) synthase TruB [Treponema sp.]